MPGDSEVQPRSQCGWSRVWHGEEWKRRGQGCLVLKEVTRLVQTHTAQKSLGDIHGSLQLPSGLRCWEVAKIFLVKGL